MRVIRHWLISSWIDSISSHFQRESASNLKQLI